MTGQPNAMGGREVGGLATMLACHMDLNSAAHRRTVQQFWNSPTIANKPGLTVVELFDAVAEGKVKAIWIMATNPVDSMPNANKVKDAIAHCPFVVVSEVSSAGDTVELAHVSLPSQPFGEKNGTVTNSERRISRMRCFLDAKGEAKPDWWAVTEVAKRMGYNTAFNYQTVADIFREYATLSGFENNGERDFDISAYANVSNLEYDALTPFQWPKARGSQPRMLSHSARANEKAIRFFSNGHFYTHDHKANMLPVSPPLSHDQASLQPEAQVLNTGRIRDQWHTMTRTGYSSRLMSHYAEPFAEIPPHLAVQYGIDTGDIVKLSSRCGQVLLRASVSSRQRPNEVFVPMHWSNQFASAARIDSVVDDRIDPHSRQPAFKNQSVSLCRFPSKSFGYVISRAPLDMKNSQGIEYWAKAPVSGGWQFELAGSVSPEIMLDAVVSQLPFSEATKSNELCCVDFDDSQRSNHRKVFFRKKRLEFMIFVSDAPVIVSRSWATSQLDEENLQSATSWQLLAGRPTADTPDKGAIVCSCMMVGEKDIASAIVKRSCLTVTDVGNDTKAGTQCGSCRNEISQMIKRLDTQILAEVSA